MTSAFITMSNNRDTFSNDHLEENGKQSTVEPVNIQARKAKRARSGCLTCRKRRRKCDEMKIRNDEGEAKCSFCDSNHLECTWPTFVNLSRTSLQKKFEGNETPPNKVNQPIQLQFQVTASQQQPIQPIPTTTKSLDISTVNSANQPRSELLGLDHFSSIRSPSDALASTPSFNSPINISTTNNQLSRTKSNLSISRLLGPEYNTMSSVRTDDYRFSAVGVMGPTSNQNYKTILPLLKTTPSDTSGVKSPAITPSLRDTPLVTGSDSISSSHSSTEEKAVSLHNSVCNLEQAIEKPKISFMDNQINSNNNIHNERHNSRSSIHSHHSILSPHGSTNISVPGYQAPSQNIHNKHIIGPQDQQEQQQQQSSLSQFYKLPEYNSLVQLYEPLNISDFSTYARSDNEDNFLELPDTLREFMYVNATTNFKTEPAPTIDQLPQEVLKEYFINVEKLSETDSDEALVLQPEQELILLKNYVDDVGGGLDMFDAKKTMVQIVPQKMKECPPLKYAVLALSSRWMESKTMNYPEELTIKLYQAALRRLIPSYNDTSNDVLIVTTCVMLCVFEMTSSSPKNWKKHLEGCALLFRSYNINGLSISQAERATFWMFIRMDICNSIISETSTVLPSNEWVMPNMTPEEIENAFMVEGMPANYIVYLCSLVINLIYSTKDGEEFKNSWLDVWMRLKKWCYLSSDVLGSVYEFYDTKIQFPRIFYSNSQAISSNQMYHMACILMLQNRPRYLKFSNLPSIEMSSDSHSNASLTSNRREGMQSTSLLYHSKRIVGISITNSDYGAYTNSLQPLYVAGLILTSKQEHGILLGALRKVEESTGWRTNWRCRDLIEYWNGEC